MSALASVGRFDSAFCFERFLNPPCFPGLSERTMAQRYRQTRRIRSGATPGRPRSLLVSAAAVADHNCVRSLCHALGVLFACVERRLRKLLHCFASRGANETLVRWVFRVV